eukprot:TRINITY_DN9983_c0_g1_i1.p1 TRINITY_DN9983_c0_g1~~TRINITY_DN9983_c0_g1_i1.p1  ORF type:complete len:203 (+),score=22.85 TRINITY_DN9983_c0_g1_i1:57-665(+)
MAQPVKVLSEEHLKMRKRFYKKTHMCSFFQANKCRRGAGCTFAHSESELQERPDFTRTRMCPIIEAGKVCYKGDLCTFAHSPEQRVSAVNMRKRRAKLASSAPLPVQDGYNSTGTSTRAPTQESLPTMPIAQEEAEPRAPSTSSVPYPRLFGMSSSAFIKSSPSAAEISTWLGSRSIDSVEDLLYAPHAYVTEDSKWIVFKL